VTEEIKAADKKLEAEQELEPVPGPFEFKLFDKDAYQMTQDLMLNTARTILVLPLGQFLNAARRAEAIGPILDPTAYREGGEVLGRMIRIASALYDAQKVIAEVDAEIKAIVAKEKGEGGASPPSGPPSAGG
jgi:hypothetical protein